MSEHYQNSSCSSHQKACSCCSCCSHCQQCQECQMYHQDTCSCCGCQIQECSSCSAQRHGGSWNKADKLLALADAAWLEVLKEEIKNRIRSGDTKIGQIADIIADVNRNRWHAKMAEKQNCDEFEKRMKDLLDQQVSGQSQGSKQQGGNGNQGTRQSSQGYQGSQQEQGSTWQHENQTKSGQQGNQGRGYGQS